MTLKPWALAMGLAVLQTTPAHAAQESGPLTVNVGLMIWTVLIFVLVLIVLGKYAWPNILGAVEAREQRIRDLIADAERDRAAAAAALEENRRLLEEARARVQAAIAESRTEAEALREQLLADARREHAELMERARRDIATEREVVLDAVRRDAVEVAMRAAEKLVRRNLDAEDNRRLVREYLGQLAEPAVPAGV